MTKPGFTPLQTAQELAAVSSTQLPDNPLPGEDPFLSAQAVENLGGSGNPSADVLILDPPLGKVSISVAVGTPDTDRTGFKLFAVNSLNQPTTNPDRIPKSTPPATLLGLLSRSAGGVFFRSGRC